MIYRETEVPGPIRRAAFCAWEFVVEAGDPVVLQHSIPPDGTTNLVLIRSPDQALFAQLVRPSLTAMTVPVAQGFHYCGLRLRPEMARAVTGREPVPGPPEFTSLEGPFAGVWRDLARLESGACDWIGTMSLFAALSAGDAMVAEAVDRIIASGGTVSLAKLAAGAGLSERQFRRRFHAATGHSPKQYADVQRVRHALILALEGADWAGVAHDSGFADQSHLTRDIRERFGTAPRRVAGYLGGIRHELLTPDPAAADVRFVQDRPARAA